MAISERYADYISRIYEEDGIDISNYISVTELIDSRKDNFDEYSAAGRTVDSDKYPTLNTIQDVVDSWKLKGDIGRDFGNALHKTFELWFRYNLRPKNSLMDGFIDKLLALGFNDGIYIPEMHVVSHKQQLVGTIDLVKVIDKTKKICAIYDYKTYNDLDEKKDSFVTGLFKPKKQTLRFTTTLQLTFYKLMLESMGWDVVELGIIQQKDCDLKLHIVEPDIESVNKLLDFKK